MSKTLVSQTAFNRGELDPALFGRSDWQSYFSGAKMLRNMIVRPQGGALKRAGTEFIVEALDQDKPSVLIRFQFSVQQVYLLEFSDYRFRVLMDGGVVTYPPGHAKAGQQVVIDSPYSAEQMWMVRTAQTQDVMILTHPSHQPRRLTRYDHHIWVFEPLTFGAGINPPATLQLTKDGRNSVQYVVAAIAANDEESLPGDVVTCATASGVGVPVPDTAAMEYTQCYQYMVSYLQLAVPDDLNVFRFTSYNPMETWAKNTNPPMFDHLYTYIGTKHSEVWFYFTSGGAYEFYNGYGQDYTEFFRNALIQEFNAGHYGVLATLRTTIDQKVAEINDNATATGHSRLAWPAVSGAVRFRVYRSANTDQGLRFYPIGETNGTTFDDDNLAFVSLEPPQTSNNPFTGPDNYPGVCLFFQQRLILARTNNMPNTFWGSRTGAYYNFNRQDVGEDDSGATVSASSAIEFTLQADQVNAIDWGVSMDDILFGTAGGEFRVSGSGGPLAATNVVASRQSNYGCAPLAPIVIGQSAMGVGRLGRVLRAYSWDYSDGAYKGTSVSHYAGHLFRRREIVGLAYQYEPESLLWAVMSDGALLSCVYMPEEEVLGWTRHDTDGRFEAVVNMSSLDGDDEVWFLVAREVNGATKRFIERLKRVQDEGDDVREAWHVDCGLQGRFAEPRSVIGGLGHLEGKAVACLADGNVYEGLTVAGGAITLPEEVYGAIVGLPFAAELETMDLEPLGGGSLAQQTRRPIQASILFYNSRECLYGRPGRNWPVKFWTDASERPLLPRTVRKGISIPATADGTTGGVWLSSPSPVPFGVLSLAVEMSVGEMAPNPGRKLG